MRCLVVRFALVALLVYGVAFGKSDVAVALEAATGVVVVEEAVRPSTNEHYILIEVPAGLFPDGVAPALRAFLTREYGQRGLVALFTVYPRDEASAQLGSHAAVSAIRVMPGASLQLSSHRWTGTSQLQRTYGATNFLLESSPTTTPPDRMQTPSPRPTGTQTQSPRPTGRANTCDYTSASTYTTYICFDSRGFATYRNHCTISYVGGVYRSSCTTTTW
jgi:hypothetical protein